MNINEFKSRLEFSGARPNLFRVRMTFPEQLGEASAAQEAEFLIKATALPEFTIGTIPINYRGRIIKLAGDRTFADWSVTVLYDEDYLIRNAFERWSNAINGMVENVTAGDTRTYMKDGRVDQLAKDGSVIRTYVIRDMFPTTVAAIPLSYDTTDTIQEFDVTLAYQYFEVESPTGVTT